MLRVEGLHIQVGELRLSDITFSVADGSYFVLLGVSGAGKTLLLEALAGLQPVQSGMIAWNDDDITCAAIQKRGMGLVYQDQALFPHLTVKRNIAYGAKGTPAEVNQLADDVGVLPLLDRYPGTLSGGEAQRVALARALAMHPRCLLLDEPLSSLDIQARSAMRALLRKLHRQGQTVIHVTHDYEEALSLATHVAIIEKGGIAQSGTPTDVFQHPRSEFVARFVGIRNVFPGTLNTDAGIDGDTATFTSAGIQFKVMTREPSGPGLMVIRSEDVILSANCPDSSAQNYYPGTVTDMVAARLGIEVYVDIGLEIAALVTSGSVERLSLAPGGNVWVSFKASAARFLEE